MVKASTIISIVISAILMGALLPIGLNDVLAFTSTNSTIQTLVSSVLPIVAVIGIIVILVPKDGGA